MKKNKIFAMMAVAMTFAACSTSDITSDYSFDDDKNTVTVSSVTRAGENQTTTPSTTVDMHEPFLLTNLTQKDKARYNYEAVFEYDSNNNSWEPSEKVMWYGSGENVFQATYPCVTKNSNSQYSIDYDKFMIPGYQYNNSDSIPDWMRATIKATRSIENGTVKPLAINLQHMLSKVTVVCNYSGTPTIDGKTITGASVNKIFTRVQYCKAVKGEDGKVTIQSYENSAYGTEGLYVWTTNTPDNTNKKASSTAIVAPGAYTKIGKIYIDYDGGNEEVVVSIPDGINLEAGKHYTFTLNISNITHNQATISSVSVEPWIAGNEITTTPAEKIIPYVTFTSNEAVGFKMEAVKGEESDFIISGLEYSVNNDDWTQISGSGMSEAITFGGGNGNLRLRGKNLSGTATNMGYAKISFTPANSDAKVACTGDIRTLLDYENYNTVDTKDARFSHLFENCTQLTSAPELPATTLANSCYSYMFKDCISLTTAPELPATTLSSSCYSQMFEGCTSLETAPALPATTLANYCYYQMFNGCTSLETAPELPATTLADGCYSNMFNGCTSLTTAPELKATTLERYCYSNMFNGCTSLKTAPALPATTLADNCYSYMFSDCTSLTTAPELPATTLADKCYSNMFNGCTSLTTAPALKATTLADECYLGMFKGCTSLETAPALKAETLAESCYQSMFQGCTKLTTAPELKATTLADKCYSNMFEGCTKLTTAPELKATTLASNCYSGMFKDCTSLTQAPTLPVETLAESCYSSMFYGCTKLESVTMLATDVSKTKCLYNWLNDAGKDATSRKLQVNSWKVYEAIKKKNYLPTNWQAGANNTKILDKDGKDITSTITSPTNQ